MSNNLDLNSAVIQSTGLTLLAGGGAFLLDQSLPSPKIITSASEIPLVFAEVVAQLSLNQVGLKILNDFLSQYSARSTYLPLLGAVLLPMVQPNLIAKLSHLFQGVKLLSNPSFLKVSHSGSKQFSTGTTIGAPDTTDSGPAPTGPVINDAMAVYHHE